MPTFGKRPSQRPASANGGSGGAYEMYLKTFDIGQHRIRVLEDDPENWIDIREHFDPGLKMSYPCARHEGSESCVGCEYPVEHPEYEDLDTHFPGLKWREQMDARKKADKGWNVRDVSKKRIFPCIDAKNYISIFKIGTEMHQHFIDNYKVLGSLLNTEFVVKREGTGFNTNTSVTPVPGEVRQPKYAVPGEKEIGETLGRKYAYALEKYGYDPGEEPISQIHSQPDPGPVVDPDNPQAPATGPAATPDAGQDEGPFIPREKSAGEIKDWLDKAGVAYPPKAPRNVLTGLAEKKLTELAGNPPF